MGGGAVVSGFLDRVEWLLARAGQTDSPEIAAAADQVRAAVDDSPIAARDWLWRGCDHLARPNASTYDRTKYAATCGGWEDGVRAALATLAAARTAFGDVGGAEVANSLSDEAATMGEQSGDVLPSRENFQFPEWVKWAVGLIAANELLKAWERLRS